MFFKLSNHSGQNGEIRACHIYTEKLVASPGLDIYRFH